MHNNFTYSWRTKTKFVAKKKKKKKITQYLMSSQSDKEKYNEIPALFYNNWIFGSTSPVQH